jgi:hypothetical protein
VFGVNLSGKRLDPGKKTWRMKIILTAFFCHAYPSTPQITIMTNDQLVKHKNAYLLLLCVPISEE